MKWSGFGGLMGLVVGGESFWRERGERNVSMLFMLAVRCFLLVGGWVDALRRLGIGD